jgi:2Fe-2S ferredoxin
MFRQRAVGFASRTFLKHHQHHQPKLVRFRLFSNGRDDDDDDDDVAHYLENTLGIDNNLHKGILKEIESIHGKDIRVDHLESLGKLTIEALAVSVEEEELLKKKRGMKKKRPSISIRIKIPHHDSREFDVDWKLGSSLLDVAKDNEELMEDYMEGACSGNMSCCTCHVYIEQPEFRECLNEPTYFELDMLDLAYEPKDSSRLGCQVKLTPTILDSLTQQQLEVTIPAGVNNVLD